MEDQTGKTMKRLVADNNLKELVLEFQRCFGLKLLLLLLV